LLFVVLGFGTDFRFFNGMNARALHVRKPGPALPKMSTGFAEICIGGWQKNIQRGLRRSCL